MIYEKLVLNYLKRNYSIVTNENEYIIKDNFSNSLFFDIDNFIKNFQKIFPSDISSRLINIWCNRTIAKYETEINEFLEHNIIKDLGKESFVNLGICCYKNNPIYSHSFIENKCEKYYFDKKVKPFIDSFLHENKELYDYKELIDKTLKIFNYDKNTNKIEKIVKSFYLEYVFKVKLDKYLFKLNLNIGSLILEKDFEYNFANEIKTFGNLIKNNLNYFYKTNYLDKIINYFLCNLTTETTYKGNIEKFKTIINLERESIECREYCFDRLNKWYIENVLDDKIDDFLNQLIITLGRTEWIVTWVGHGRITENEIVDKFKEAEYHSSYITKKYDEWYFKQIIGKTEKLKN